jgi:hypothetical protein
MNNEASDLSVATLFIITFIGGGVVGGLIVYFSMSRLYAAQPINPEYLTGKRALDFYVDYLRNQNFTVTEKGLSTNIYSQFNSIGELLWALNAANLTECYYDYGEGFGILLPQPKLWIQFDGVYWELRF